MIVQISNEYDGSDFKSVFCFHYKVTASSVISAVLSSEGCPYDAEVDIRLVSDPVMRKLNKKMRGIDRTTDVLSFPMTQYTPPADFSIPEKEKEDAFDPDTGLLVLGDIVLSVPKIKAQAEEYGHSTKREFAFLLAHSTLHLLGYDHQNKTEEQVMTKKQEAVLENLHILRYGGKT